MCPPRIGNFSRLGEHKVETLEAATSLTASRSAQATILVHLGYSLGLFTLPLHPGGFARRDLLKRGVTP